ncbi:VTT domain-containing protein [Mongoliitalea daihaiensis]|uniref:VTT domain-containing protein n=1 Tax=Mongoliitalea daihaiensis TaxID=2782006 RepID=UPI001F2016E6|nr:VTT domain-containing protein [Mongoliitalea daihaiensis]UJP66485.1 VTT domain-containing protein [Mongoliitalea daihaiensis]
MKIWQPTASQKTKFMLYQVGKGFFFLGILVGIFFILRHLIGPETREEWFGAIYNNPTLVMLVFVTSEHLFGIVPPEIFMLWALETKSLGPYYLAILVLSVISYGAGWINFNLGRAISKRYDLEHANNRFIRKNLALIKEYGAYMVIVASISPLPFSAIALLAGSSGISQKKYLLNSLFRILRFFVYAYVLYKIQQ